MKHFLKIVFGTILMFLIYVPVYAENYNYLSKWGDKRTTFPFSDRILTATRHIAADSGGNVYVSNFDRIIKYDTGGNFVTMWTDCSGSGLSWPNGLAVDKHNNVYVTEVGRNRVIRYTPSGACSVVAEGVTAGFNDPEGVAVDDLNTVYVSDTGNHVVKVFDRFGNLTATWSGFSQPWGITVDGDFIYVGDGGNHTVSKLTKGGALIKQWGSFGIDNTHFFMPIGVAVYDGSVYIAEVENQRISFYDTDGNFEKILGERGTGNGQFQFPTGTAIDKARGFLYVSDADNNRIQKFDLNGNFISQFGCDATGSTGVRYPTKVAIDNNNNFLYVVDSGNHRIKKLSSNMQLLGGWGSYGDGDGQFRYPYAAVVDSLGYVYVVDNVNRNVQKFTSDGVFVKKWQVNFDPLVYLYGLHGIAVDGNDNLYVVDAGTNMLYKFDSQGNKLAAWDINYYTTGIDIDKTNGLIYVVHYNKYIRQYDMNWNFIREFGTQLSHLGDLSVDIMGNIFAVYGQSQTIVKFDPLGNIVTKWGNPNTWVPARGNGLFTYPYGVTVDNDGYVYVADTNNHRIQKFQPDDFWLNVSISPSSKGTVTGGRIRGGINCPGVCAARFALSGTSVQISASPAVTGYHFVNWTGNISSTANPANVVLTVPYTNITANFAKDSNLSVSPMTSDFLSIFVGSSSAPQLFTISNASANATALSVSSISITGMDSSMFKVSTGTCSSLSPTIAPGSSCTVKVRFMPASTGSKSANLSIISNDLTSPTLNIPLYGSGTSQSAFNDIAGNFAESWINTVYYNGVIFGCGSGNFCPQSYVSRGDMAAFVLRAMGIEPAATCTGTVFDDVNVLTVGDSYCRYIEKFKELNITAGCDSRNYCPSNSIIRAQMAIFLTRAMNQQPTAVCTGTVFNDINSSLYGGGTSGDTFCRYIEKFYTLGVTAGCVADDPNTPMNERMYCPDTTITRDQMSIFLTRGFLQ